MTESLCGAETATTDEPCQNPALYNGRCWIESHQDQPLEDDVDEGDVNETDSGGEHYFTDFSEFVAGLD